MIISKHDDRIFAECDCGCSIIAINNWSKDVFYLQYFGNQKIKSPDFVFSKGLTKFTTLLTRACNFIFTDKECENFREIEIGYIENKTDKEALSVHVDTSGIITINKYRRNYKKFIKSHDREFELIGFRDSIPYKKCKCDWEFLIDREHAKELRDELLKLGNCDYKVIEEDFPISESEKM